MTSQVGGQGFCMEDIVFLCTKLAIDFPSMKILI